LGVNLEEFDYLGEPSDLKVRAAMLDEGLEVLTGLWQGTPFSYAGQYYRIKEALFMPAPLQQPRIRSGSPDNGRPKRHFGGRHAGMAFSAQSDAFMNDLSRSNQGHTSLYSRTSSWG